MPLSVYIASIPVYARGLRAADRLIDRASAHAEAGGMAPSALIDASLFPDMWPFGRQVRAIANHATRGPARVCGLPVPERDQEDTTFADLKARIAWADAFVAGIDSSAMDNGGDRPITGPIGGEQRTLTGQEYLLGFSLPNFYFHLATAYGILRHNGVPLKKADFLGEI